MGLPVYLAMAAEEMEYCPSLPPHIGWFSLGSGTALPASLPPGALLILTDRIPLQVTADWIRAMTRLGCGGVLLDFEHPPAEDTRALVHTLSEVLPCPVAAPPGYCDGMDCAVFLPPCPLHVPLRNYLYPWRERDIWLDVTAQQQTITVTGNGTAFGPVTPADRQGGTCDDTLCCQVTRSDEADTVCFTLFDTADTLKEKLVRAEALGVSRAVGLFQELAKWA